MQRLISENVRRKVALITGGKTGIGLETAKLLASINGCFEPLDARSLSFRKLSA